MRYVIVVFLGAVFGLWASTTVRDASALSCITCYPVYEPLTYVGVESLNDGTGDVSFEENVWDVDSIGIAPLGVPSTRVRLGTDGDSDFYVDAAMEGSSE